MDLNAAEKVNWSISLPDSSLVRVAYDMFVHIVLFHTAAKSILSY